MSTETPEKIAVEEQDERAGKVSASAFEILAECWGQPQLKQSLPPEALTLENEAKDPLTDRGTRIHRARELMDDSALTEEESAIYKSGLECEAKLLERWRTVFNLSEITEGERELRLWLHDARLDPIMSGKLDVHFLSGTHAIVLDWKTGFCSNLVGAPGNWQLRSQAVLLSKEFPHLTNIRVAFVKPLFERADLDYVDYVPADLEYSYQSIVYLLWWSTQPDAPRRAGNHCRYCACKPYCPEALSWALLPSVIARMASPESTKPDEMVALVKNEDLLAVWDRDTVCRKILDAVDTRLKSLPKEELARMGLELPAEGKPRDTVKDVRGAFEFLKTVQNLPEEKLWRILKLTKTGLADVLVQERSLAAKCAGKLATELLQDFSERTHDAPSLKRMEGI